MKSKVLIFSLLCISQSLLSNNTKSTRYFYEAIKAGRLEFENGNFKALDCEQCQEEETQTTIEQEAATQS